MNNKNKYKIALTLAILLFGKNIFAQESRQLGLNDAVDLAIKNSSQLKIFNAKIEEAVAAVREANDNKLPDLKVSGSYLRLSSANVNLKSRSDSAGGSSSPKVNQAVYGIVNLAYPLYSGGRIKYGIESAKLLEKATRLDADQNRQEIVYNTTSAYINLYKSLKAVGLVKENLQSSLARDTNLSNLERNGLLARNDLLKAQLQSSNIELSLLDAENNYKVSMVNTNLLLGLPENTMLMIDSAFVDTIQDVKNFTDYEILALQNRKDVQAIGFRKKAAATGIKSARAEAYPTVVLTGGYVAADIPRLLSVTNAVNVGVGLQYNLASLWKTNTGLLQARAREKEVTAMEEILNDNIRLQVNKDYQDYLLSRKKIDVYEKAVVQATENYRITNNKYINNLITITDLLDADVANLQAKLNLSFAKADAVLAYNKLLQTTGSISK